MLKALLTGSIRKRLALLFLFSALPAFLLILLAGLKHTDDAVAKSEQELLRFTLQLADTQARTTASVRMLLETLAKVPEVRQGKAAPSARLFASLLKDNPRLAGINLVDLKGDLIASGTTTATLNFAHTKHFRDALRDKTFVAGEYLLSVTLNIPVIAFGFPVLDDQGGVQAVLLTSIRLDSFGRQFEQMSFPPSSFVGACDHRGIRLYRHPEIGAGPLGKPVRHTVFEAVSTSRSEGFMEDSGTDGISRILAYAPLSLEPGKAPYMYVFCGAPKSAIVADARAVLFQDLGLFLLAVALTLTSGWFFGGRSLGLRLEELAEASNRIGSGDHGVRVDPDPGITELATLARSFNSMAESLARDITERAQSAEALKESELRFKALHNASFGGITIHDKGVILDCNQGLSVISGYEYEELIGMDGLLLIAEGSRAQVMANILAGYEKPYEAVGLRKNGEQYPLRLEARNIPYQGRNVRVVEFRDITETKRAEEALRMEVQRRRILMEKSSDGIVTIGPDHRVVEANQRFADMLGYSREEVLGLYTWDYEAVMPEEQIRASFADFPSVSAVFESRHRRKDGSVFDVEVSVSGVLVGDQPLVFAICRDITERKRAEEETRRTTEFLNSLITYANAPIIVWDPDFNISKFNRAFEGLTGLDRDEVTGRSLELLFPPEQAEKIMDYIRRTSSAGERWETVEIPIQHRDGSVKTVLWNSAGILAHDGSRIVATIAQGQDITERKRAEEELHHSKELAEAANRAKSEFLANMSHEIRTPLNGLLGMLQIIRTSGVSGDVECYTEMAIRAGHRLTSLLGDILDLSRIEAGRMPITRQSFALGNITDALAETFSPMHYSKQLNFHINADPDVPGQLVGDELRVRQILFNLIGNAMKFTDHGEVRLDISPLLPLPSGEARLLFVVCDTGMGIPQEKLTQICVPFIQVSKDFTRSHQGAGLGLAIAQRLVDALGGTLTFESTEHLGTCVYLVLPFGLPERARQEADGPQPEGQRRDGQHSARQAPEADPHGPLRLLLVEDDEISRLGARLALEKMGHTVATANDGAQALDELRARPFDCVLMDVQMDVMDGVEATRRIRGGDSGVLDPRIPVIALTAYAMSGDRERFLAAGMDDYVPKPVQMAEMRKALRRVMTGPGGRG